MPSSAFCLWKVEFVAVSPSFEVCDVVPFNSCPSLVNSSGYRLFPSRLDRVVSVCVNWFGLVVRFSVFTCVRELICCVAQSDFCPNFCCRVLCLSVIWTEFLKKTFT